MMNVLLVDDERIFREALRVAIPWNELGLSICAEAQNGEEALEALKENPVNIVLTDINMSRMNGLDFIQKAKSIAPDVKFIIISGYDDFSYAKRAITLGVTDYIVKPIDEEELKKVLIDIKKRISSDKMLRKNIADLNNTVAENRLSLKKNFLTRLISNTLPSDKNYISENISHYNIKVGDGYFAVAYIEISKSNMDEWTMQDKNLWTFAVENVASELLGEFAEVIIEDIGALYVILLGFKDEKEILKRCELVKMFVSENLPFEICIGVGALKNSIEEIYSSFHEAKFVVSAVDTLDDSIVAIYSDIRVNTLDVPLSKLFNNSDFILSLHTGNTKKCIQMINELFLNLNSVKASFRTAYILFLEIILCCLDYIKEQTPALNDELLELYNKAYENAISAKNTTDMCETVAGLVENLHKKTENYQQNNMSLIVKQAIDYIRQNFNDPYLNIEVLAQKTYSSYGHLCFVFKKETNQTINEYILETRMNKAQKLLLSDSMTVSNVALSVGYLNTNYFSKMFKKRYNVLPSELKKRE